MKAAELQAPIGDPTSGEPLMAWRWLVEEPAVPFMVTVLGDVFLRGQAGDIWFLDTYEGRYTRVANDETSWRSAMEDPGTFEAWFSPDLVAAIEARGLRLSDEECFSPILPLVFGGLMAPENFERSPWLLHVGLSGQAHEEARKHPDGTPIARFVDADDVSRRWTDK